MNTHQVILQGMAINQSQAEDRQKTIPYRPQYTQITGTVSSAILLQQIRYWWFISGRKPFYKFKAPCPHDRYRDGDSWCEELGFTVHIFDSAIKAIGKKITKGTSKTNALRENLVIYWTDSSRVTWYQFNESLMSIYVYLVYNKPDLLGKCEKRIYLDKDEKAFYLDKDEKRIYLFSDTTPGTSSITISKEEHFPKNPPESSASFPTESHFPPLAEIAPPSDPPITEFKDPFAMAAECEKRNGGKRSITIPAVAGGASDFDPVLEAFCKITDQTVPKTATRRVWIGKFRDIADKEGLTPVQMLDTVLKLPLIHKCQWFISEVWTSPMPDSFQDKTRWLSQQLVMGKTVEEINNGNKSRKTQDQRRGEPVLSPESKALADALLSKSRRNRQRAEPSVPVVSGIAIADDP